MNIYYLIDFENVREMGISALSPTDNKDHIYVFYTENASKLSMDAFLGHDGEIKFIKVAAGKQSLDMHLISVLGFLLRDQGEEKEYVIVSRDGGYDNVIHFWKDKGFLVSRDNINMSAPVIETAPLQEKNAVSKKNKKNPANRRNNLKKNRQNVTVEEKQIKTADESVEEQIVPKRESVEEVPAVSVKEEKTVEAEVKIAETESIKEYSAEETSMKFSGETAAVTVYEMAEAEGSVTEQGALEEKETEEADKTDSPDVEKVILDAEEKTGTLKEKNTGKKKNSSRRNNSKRKKAVSNDAETTQTEIVKAAEDKSEDTKTVHTNEQIQEEAADKADASAKEILPVTEEREEAAGEEKEQDFTNGKKKAKSESAKEEPAENRGEEADAHTAMNNKLMALLREKTDVNTSGAITSIVVRNIDAKNYKQVIYRQMVKKFGQKEGLKNYNLIKKDI